VAARSERNLIFKKFDFFSERKKERKNPDGGAMRRHPAIPP
jgi:hypothetical protein